MRRCSETFRFLWSSGLAELLSARTLKSLNLSECVHVSGAEMVKGLKGSGSSSQLELLALSSCIYIRVSPDASVPLEGRREEEEEEEKSPFLICLSRILQCFPSLRCWGTLSASWT